jgi:hypothetical protein
MYNSNVTAWAVRRVADRPEAQRPWGEKKINILHQKV